MNQSLPSTENLRKNNIRYSRHFSFQHQRLSLNGRSQLIIHAKVRSPSNKRRSLNEKSLDINHDLHLISTILTARYRQSEGSNSNNISNLTDQTALRVTRSLSLNRDFQQHQLTTNPTIYNNWNNNNDLRKSFQEQNDRVNNNFEDILQRQQLPSDANKNLTNRNSNLFLDYTSITEKKDLWSNTNDFQQNPNRNKKKKKRYLGVCPGSCPCLIASLLAALLLAIAIAATLLAFLFKSQPITTISTALSTTSTTITTQTTISTTQTTTSTSQTTTSTSQTTTDTTQSTTSTTQTTAVTTSTITTTPVPSTTTTPVQCNTAISSVFNYTGPITQNAICTFTAISTGSLTLQFSFQSQGGNKIGYLDYVSIVDRTASNSEMLTNGGFESGTFTGWQQLPVGNCNADAGSITIGASCNTGLFCYRDGCKNGMDYLSQTFTTTIGHVYTLNFWIQVSNNQDVYVRIL